MYYNGYMSNTRKKGTICATLYSYIRKQIEKLVENKEFSSMSYFVSVAVTRLLSEIESEKRLTNQPSNEKKVMAISVVIE